MHKINRILSVTFCLVLTFMAYSQSFTAYLPKEGTVTGNQTPEFKWNEVQGATQYELQIATDYAFTQNLLSNTTAATDFTLSTPLIYGDYFWRVLATAPSGQVNSQVYQLTIFTPGQLPDLSLWLRADQGVTLDASNKVEAWQDQSTNAHNLAQTTAGKRPEVNPTGFANLPTMKFDGGQVLDGGNILNLGTNSRTFISVAKITGANQTIYAKSIAAATANRLAFLREGASFTSLYIDNGQRNVNSLAGTNVFDNIFLTSINRSNGQHRLYINQDIKGNNAINASYNFNSTYRFLVGGYNNASDNGEVLFLNGNISEIIFFDNVDSVNQARAYQYIKDRYMPQLDLGADLVTPYGFCLSETIAVNQTFESYLWSDGSTGNSITVTTPGEYWVEVTDKFGFVSRDTIRVKAPQIAMPSALQYCPGDVVTWDVGLGNDYDYLWSTGETTQDITIPSTGNYHLSITDTNGCVFESDTLFIEEDLFATQVSLGPDQSLCSGNSIALVAGDSNIVSYTWSTGATTPSVVVNTTGLYELDLVNGNGCTASDEVLITIVGDAPVVDLGFSGVFCQNEVINFQDASFTVDGSNIVEWQWDFGDGTTTSQSNGQHVYTQPGIYIVELFIDTDAGCNNISTDTLLVNGQPSLSFSASNFCQGEEMQFNASQNTPTIINTWDWDFDDVNSGTNTGSGQQIGHIFSDAGAFAVTLIGTDINSCKDTVVNTINVNPSPQVQFSFNEVCQGGIVNFQNESTIASPALMTGRTWSFGDGTTTTQNNPSKGYFIPGNYNIGLTITANNGCISSASETMKVHALPQPDFTVDAACAGIEVNFEDNSFVPNGSVAQVDWEFGDNNSGNGFNVSHSYTSQGTYDVIQTVHSAFGCSTTVNRSVTVHPALTASFSSDPLAILAGIPTTFFSTSIGANNYQWELNGDTVSQAANFEVLYDSTQIGDLVSVVHRTSNSVGCATSSTQTYTVLPFETDLALTELFLQDLNGFYTIGVLLENKGTTPLTEVDLFLRTTNTQLIRETWEGELQAGASEIYVFSASPSSVVMESKAASEYICVEGKLGASVPFEEVQFDNNSICEMPGSADQALILKPYPNPVSENLTINLVLPTAGEGSLYIYNAQGQLVKAITEQQALSEGLNIFHVDVSRWVKGMYFIQYQGGKESANVKVVVM